ncbi:MAG: putative phage tail sheath protein [Polaromonas sp.]|nr:putative phage tail sheath protein [Polaromonas sp.]
MPVVQQGSINTTALIVPDLYVQIVPPSVSLLNGVPTNILGVVGTAQWGPVNAPVIFGSMADYALAFGALQNRKYDMGTVVATAVQQGASNFRGVRVTDGTDAAATLTIGASSVASAALGGTLSGYTTGATVAFSAPPVGGTQATGTVTGTGTLTAIVITNPGSGYVAPPTATITPNSAGTGATATSTLGALALTLTAKYTGTLGNSLVATVGAGSAANTGRLTVGLPGRAPEVFDNIAGSGNAFWLAAAAAINNGQNGLRGASALVTAAAAAGTLSIPAASFTASGGLDGAGVAATNLVGADTGTRTGMYALRGTGAAVGVLADCDTSTTWASQIAYSMSEGTYMVGVGPAGDSIANAVSVKATAGVDSYGFKLLQGDWVYWNDPVAGLTRLVSPQGFVAGLLSNLSPEQSSLNKQLYGVVGTQRSAANQVYSGAELQLLGQAGIDVVCNPVPGGSYFGARFGHNSSSNPVTNGDNYTRMTNYLAYSFNAGMGRFVGRLQSMQVNDPTRRQAGSTLSNFLQNMKDQVQVDDFSVVCDLTNNTPTRIALGYMQADVKVRYLSVVEKFLVNLEGGQSVTVVRQQTTQAQ